MTKTPGKGIRADDDGRTYEWNGRVWVDVATFLRASSEVADRLRRFVQPEIRAFDDAIRSFDGLLSASAAAKEIGDLTRADRLISRALAIRPSHEGALSVLCSLRRKQGDPERGLLETEAVGSVSRHAPLLTSRAAALCDVGRWDDAKQLMDLVVLEIGNAGPEASAVVERIATVRVDCYDSDPDM